MRARHYRPDAVPVGRHDDVAKNQAAVRVPGGPLDSGFVCRPALSMPEGRPQETATLHSNIKLTEDLLRKRREKGGKGEDLRTSQALSTSMPLTPRGCAAWSGANVIPSTPFVTFPNLRIWSTLDLIESTGIANPMPELLPDVVNIAVFIPISFPEESSRGPPEFPGLMAASVWIMSCSAKYMTQSVGEGAERRSQGGGGRAGGRAERSTWIGLPVLPEGISRLSPPMTPANTEGQRRRLEGFWCSALLSNTFGFSRQRKHLL